MEKRKRKPLDIELSEISLKPKPIVVGEGPIQDSSFVEKNREQVYQRLLENTCESLAQKIKSLEDITKRLNYVFTLMNETNPNIHPIKYHILNNWKIQIREAQDELNELLASLTQTLAPYTGEQVSQEVTSDGSRTH